MSKVYKVVKYIKDEIKKISEEKHRERERGGKRERKVRHQFF